MLSTTTTTTTAWWLRQAAGAALNSLDLPTSNTITHRHMLTSIIAQQIDLVVPKWEQKSFGCSTKMRKCHYHFRCCPINWHSCVEEAKTLFCYALHARIQIQKDARCRLRNSGGTVASFDERLFNFSADCCKLCFGPQNCCCCFFFSTEKNYFC